MQNQYQDFQKKKVKKVKKEVIKMPEASLQVSFFNQALREQFLRGDLELGNTYRSARDAFFVINKLVWIELEKLYITDIGKFNQHYKHGKSFELLTNSHQITRMLFSGEMYIKGITDSENPEFLSYRSRWYKGIYKFLRQSGYIISKKNYAVGRYASEWEGGRGNFGLEIDIAKFMFGNEMTINLPNESVSDESDFTGESGQDFSFCPANRLEKSYSSILKKDSVIQNQGTEEKREIYGEAKLQFFDDSKLHIKKEKALPNQGATPELNSKEKKHEISHGAEKLLQKPNPSVSEQEKTTVLVGFASKLNQIFNQTILQESFLDKNQYRWREDSPCDNVKIRDYTTDFVKILQHGKDQDETEFSPIFDRIEKILTDKVKWLEKDPTNWMYHPDIWLSVEKKPGTKEFRYNSGTLITYHNRYILPYKEKITPNLSGDLVELFESFYPKMKEFGVSDKFLRDALKRYGKDKVLNEVKRSFARLAQGVKVKSKGDYLRNNIRRADERIVGEKANLEVKKVEIAQASAPTAAWSMSEATLKSYILKHYGDDAPLFSKQNLYEIKLASKTPDSVRSHTDKVLNKIKLQKFETEVAENLLQNHPSVSEMIQRDYRIAQKMNTYFLSKESFIIEKLKNIFPDKFNKNQNG
jgi:hypothetical protein